MQQNRHRRRATTGSGHDRVHWRSSGGAWGRADLQSLVDCPSVHHEHARRSDPARWWRDEALRKRQSWYSILFPQHGLETYPAPGKPASAQPEQVKSYFSTMDD